MPAKRKPSCAKNCNLIATVIAINSLFTSVVVFVVELCQTVSSLLNRIENTNIVKVAGCLGQINTA